MKKTFIVLFISTLFSQEGSITGSVRDLSNNDPLIGANVILEGTSLGAASDSEGRYTISNLQSGEYTISVSYIGFKTLKKEISLGKNQNLIVELELDPEAIQMETYVVTASRRRERVEDAPAAISVISKTQIRRESNANLGDYIKGTKGIDFTQSGIDSYNMTARGFNSSFSSRLLTLTDGRMANVPSLRLTAYNVIPVSFEDVEQIEVVLGPASALYGPNAHSGVLNIVTASPLRSQGTSINIQGGLLNQSDTDLLKKLSFRTAHKFGKFGFKMSGVALSGQDWTHINPDEHEGHDPVFIGRPVQKHDGIDQLGYAGLNTGEEGSPIFTESMLKEVDGSKEEWVGLKWADNIATGSGEPGSPLITQEMVDAAADDEFQRFVVNDEITLWFVTADKIGRAYADGIDNDGNGAIDNNIDIGIDDANEHWYDGVDNDGDGLIDEADEMGSQWLKRFGSYYDGIEDGQYFGFGDHQYDEDGNIEFDTNKNDEYGDNWGDDGLDNDGDWGPWKDELGNAFDVSEEEFTDLNDNGVFDEGYGEGYIFGALLDYGLDGIPAVDNNGDGDYDDDGDIAPDEGEGNGVWDGEVFTDLNGNQTWDQFINNDLDGDGAPSSGEVGVDEFDERDFKMNYGGLSSIYKDANDDGIDDYPTFKVRNYRYDLRLDWEPNNDAMLSLSHGYAWARNINITGIARYLADGWVYRYYQSRARYKNIFFQAYLNTSYSGDPDRPTRNLATGSTIFDQSKKFSAQLQQVNEWLNGDFRLVWGLDYFLTMPDTRGTILRDKEFTDLRDNNGNGEAGSPFAYNDRNDDSWYTNGERYTAWHTNDANNTQFANPLDSIGVDENGNTIYDDLVLGAIKDGFDNDGDSDDFEDLNGNKQPDYVDANGNGEYDIGEQVEPGVQWLGDQNFIVYADKKDNDGDGKIDENIDEGIDEASEDNRYNVNELGLYYQMNWKLNKKWEFIQATRFDVHDRLSNFVEFNNQGYGQGYSPFNWDFNFDKTEGLQLSPKVGLVYRPKENQNYRLTWATAFNTPTNQALFLDIFITRVSIFKVYARGADGGYNFPTRNVDNGIWDEDDEFVDLNNNGTWDEGEEWTDGGAEDQRPLYYDTNNFEYRDVDKEESVLFYPSTDPRFTGFYGDDVYNLPELEAEVVKSWEFGYKGRLNQRLFGTLDLYTSHYSSFVSPVTFITPIVLEKRILETDYNGDGIVNRVDDVVNNDFIADPDDYDESFDNWTSGIKGVTALDTTPGYTPPVVVGYINYGEIDMWGMDASLTYILNLEWSLDVNYSHLGMTDFYNPITKNKDPINAPRHKAGMKLAYNSRRWPISGSLNARYVDGFSWSSGIYYGDITPYTIFDVHAGYEITEKLKINLTLNNVFNNFHTEIIGGPSLGRVALLRLTTTL